LGGGGWGWRGGYHSSAPVPYFGGLLVAVILIVLLLTLFHPYSAWRP
jgi:hypothetical protein